MPGKEGLVCHAGRLVLSFLLVLKGSHRRILSRNRALLSGWVEGGLRTWGVVLQERVSFTRAGIRRWRGTESTKKCL